MTLRHRLVAAFAVLTGLAACQRDAPTAMAAPRGAARATGEYGVGVVLAAVHGATQVLVNGFPLDLGPGADVIAMDAPDTRLDADATTALVSGRNTVAVRVVPALQRTGEALSAGPSRFLWWVYGPDGAPVPGTSRGSSASDAAFTAWEADVQRRWRGWLASEDSLYAAQPALRDSVEARIASDADAAYMGVGPALDAARAWARAHPVTVTAHFTRPGGARPSDGQPSFDALFREVRIIAGTAADSARLRAYAVRLRELNAERDTAALFDEFRPKVADSYARAQVSRRIRESTDGLRDSTTHAENARSGILVTDAEPFGARDVRMRSWVDGRVWELYRDGSAGLLQRIRSDGTRGSYWKVYVAEVGGRLRVVRT